MQLTARRATLAERVDGFGLAVMQALGQVRDFVVLAAQLLLLNAAPEGPYFALTLRSWEQGRFIHFHGLAQWVGWLWPYVTLAYLLIRMGRPDGGQPALPDNPAGV